MPVETEVKLRVDDPTGLRRRLTELGAEVEAPRHFEDNFVLDFPGGPLRARGSAIRIRRAGGSSTLTFKGPSRPEGVFKSREEIETGVEDGAAALAILEGLGLALAFRYQKYREEFRVRFEDANEVLHVALDETPVGSYAEIEGTEPAIRRLAAALGYCEGDFVRDSYYTLYVRSCRERGDEVGHMTFAGAA